MLMLEFQHGTSLLHRMSPIGKFVWGGIIVLWLFLMFNPLHVLGLGIAILIVAKWGAGLSIISLLRTSLLVGVAGISILLFQTFLYQNGETEIFRLGPLAPTYEGLNVGMAIALRVLGIVAASTVIAKTTNPQDIFLALVRIHVPYKIAYGLFTAIRFIPLLEYEASIINDAQYVRGIAIKKGGIVNTFKRFTLFLIPLLATAMRRAEQSAMAMEVRAFGLYETRTYSHDLVIPRVEWVFVGCWLIAFIAYLVLTQGDFMNAIFYNPPTVEPWE